MSDVKDWSKSAGGNTTASPDGAPEGMPPSGVNNTMRETQASVRREREDAEWFNYGETPTWNTTGDNFTLVGDKTTDFHVNRRVKCFDASVFYGTITETTYSSSTRVTVELDSGALTASLTGVAVSILSYDNPSLVTRTKTFDVSATASVGALRVTNYDVPSGMLIHTSATSSVSYITGSATSTTTLAADASVPQITEGVPIMDFTYTPKNAGNKLHIYSVVNGSDGLIDGRFSAAMFINSAVAAVVAGSIRTTNAITSPIPLNYEYSASSSAAITISIRMGNNNGTASPVHFNGTAFYSPMFGGVGGSGIWVKEYKG